MCNFHSKYTNNMPVNRQYIFGQILTNQRPVFVKNVLFSTQFYDICTQCAICFQNILITPFFAPKKFFDEIFDHFLIIKNFLKIIKNFWIAVCTPPDHDKLIGIKKKFQIKSGNGRNIFSRGGVHVLRPVRPPRPTCRRAVRIWVRLKKVITNYNAF